MYSLGSDAIRHPTFFIPMIIKLTKLARCILTMNLNIKLNYYTEWALLNDIEPSDSAITWWDRSIHLTQWFNEPIRQVIIRTTDSPIHVSGQDEAQPQALGEPQKEKEKHTLPERMRKWKNSNWWCLFKFSKECVRFRARTHPKKKKKAHTAFANKSKMQLLGLVVPQLHPLSQQGMVPIWVVLASSLCTTGLPHQTYAPWCIDTWSPDLLVSLRRNERAWCCRQCPWTYKWIDIGKKKKIPVLNNR